MPEDDGYNVIRKGSRRRRPGEAIFVTRFDHGLKIRHPEDRAWTLSFN
jgi:hypothetical protein